VIKVENVGPERKNAHGGIEQDVLEVSVFYSKGGSNWFNGKNEPRGYYLSVTPQTVEIEDGRKYTRTRLGAGFKSFLLEAKRFSQKTLDEQAAKAAVSADLQERLKKATLAAGAVFAPDTPAKQDPETSFNILPAPPPPIVPEESVV
jgi:hypothetical protein